MNHRKAEKSNIGIAIDLGSTSIAVNAVDLSNGEVTGEVSFANPQRRFGADIITRIRYCMGNEEHLHELSTLTKEEIRNQLRTLLQDRYNDITHMAISGNTTMLHILRALSVDGLSCAPFTPVTTAYEKTQGWFDTAAVISYPPSFSAFVGADILTGAHALSIGQERDFDLLIDLGTNGELLLLNREKGYATSTACGPVFDHVIGGARYGCDCIRAISNLKKRNIIDAEGQLREPFFHTGVNLDKGMTLKQEHIRNFQLAKGALHAGVLCLMRRADISCSNLRHVYISGGLGFYMDINDAFTTRMLPDGLQDKITVVGNSSLSGALELLRASAAGTSCKEEEGATSLDLLLGEYQSTLYRTTSFELSNDGDFQNIFMSSLNF